MRIHRIGCHGDAERVRASIAEYDGKVDAIGLDGYPAELELGNVRVAHTVGATLPSAAQKTPLVDGGGIRPGIERWAVILADRAEPGIFAEKRILMAPGLNHGGLAQAFARHSQSIQYADPEIYFALPDFPGVGSKRTMEQAVRPTLEQLKDAPFRRILPQLGTAGTERAAKPFELADLIAGDIGAIRRYAPADLKRKTIVVEYANEEDVQDLRKRGATILVTMMPSMDGAKSLGQWSAATVEAVLVALRADPDQPLTEDTYLDLLADIQWTPYVRYLAAGGGGDQPLCLRHPPLERRFHPKEPHVRLDKIPPR